jgi:hypothetical protein
MLTYGYSRAPSTATEFLYYRVLSASYPSSLFASKNAKFGHQKVAYILTKGHFKFKFKYLFFPPTRYIQVYNINVCIVHNSANFETSPGYSAPDHIEMTMLIYFR